MGVMSFLKIDLKDARNEKFIWIERRSQALVLQDQG